MRVEFDGRPYAPGTERHIDDRTLVSSERQAATTFAPIPRSALPAFHPAPRRA
ncbi:hypothetical protein [Nocardiopsis sp. JB363]|uniref:hypothetical protein n=1 Tax=Nocardiopsis sp. JB363 TaxID=1434837 RepID=UPI000979E6D7|nr:hypothetical protein [Nocardiopsis sp. JB363]SIO91303.1 hypothetical protein BQ8420_31055 [Nocardiopsis sp. JB363]